jgi:Domain of unknown function (DUF4389)
MAALATYPVHVDATLDPRLSRWLWLVKWILVIPHYVVLLFLWVAFAASSIVAFFAILFTGHYPRPIFDFNLGVLRWTWRVDYYAYGALGTDRYPPFTLADVPDYPARLDIDYPEHLSRGLVLVKWWLLAIPHYLITGFFLGGGAWAAGRSQDWQWSWGGGGLISVLVVVSAVILAVTGNYPQALFDFILGMNRWALRVAGYAGLMTDRYPPFRLDLGGHEPEGTLTLTPPASPATPAAGTVAGPQDTPARWTPGRVVSLIAGAVLALFAIGLVIGGAATLWADRTRRDAAGYLTSSATSFSTTGYAVTSDTIDVSLGGPHYAYPRSVLGDLRLRFTAGDPSVPVFVGIGPTSAVARYLSGVQYSVVTDFAGGRPTYVQHAGGPPATPPGAGDIWVAKTSGPGTQSLVWTPSAGSWTIVAMKADAAAGLTARADVGATAPVLTWVAVALLVAGIVLLAAGALLIAVPVARASSDAGSRRV